jgi:Asp-tRNA(Asn)/Glu-tRNA(Gln) amidotransferase A subunit family amidase
MLANAIEQAKAHDEYQNTHHTTKGPLHGVPYTLKDTFNVQNYDSSLGISVFSNRPAESSSVLHETLSKWGAILLAKTNVPQTLLAFECNNPIFGPTHNPAVKGFTCGGSSGGEAACLARNATALGFGGDIGGSLRIPAGWCGIYSLRPTKGRFPYRGSSGMPFLMTHGINGSRGSRERSHKGC